MIKKMKKNDKDVLQDLMNIENWGFFHTMFYGVNAPPKMRHVYTIQKSIGGTCNWILKEIKKIWKIYKKLSGNLITLRNGTYILVYPQVPKHPALNETQ